MCQQGETTIFDVFTEKVSDKGKDILIVLFIGNFGKRDNAI